MMSKSVRGGDAKIIVRKYCLLIKVPHKPHKIIILHQYRAPQKNQKIAFKVALVGSYNAKKFLSDRQISYENFP